MGKVRTTELDDLPQLTRLFADYRTFYGKKEDSEKTIAFLKQRIEHKDSKIFVGYETETLWGFTQLYPLFSSTRLSKYLLLNDLYVAKDYRGRGYSKLLLEKAQQYCRDEGACGILLETDRSNVIANRLYTAMGFELYNHANFYEWTPQ